MASGDVIVTVGYDKKSLRALRKTTAGLQKCVDTLREIRELMDKLKLKRVPDEPAIDTHECEHKNTYEDRIEPTATDIEVCRDCGRSRAIYEVMEPSQWLEVDIEDAKGMCSVCFDDPILKIECDHCGGSGRDPEAAR